MSIYDADRYWKERRKAQLLRGRGSLVLLLAVVMVAGAGVVRSRRSGGAAAGALLAQRRALSDATTVQWSQCESGVNSKRECQSICLAERNSVNRKTHEACFTGCQAGHVTSVAVSCRGKVTTEAEMFDEIGGLAYLACSKVGVVRERSRVASPFAFFVLVLRSANKQQFQEVPPKPETFATCRKYHRAGLKSGFSSGLSSLNRILDHEFEESQRKQRETELAMADVSPHAEA